MNSIYLNFSLIMTTNPSRIFLPSFFANEEIWIKILEALTPLEREEANKSESEIKEPYPSCKEMIVRRTDRTKIAYAISSASNKNGDEWAIYREI